MANPIKKASKSISIISVKDLLSNLHRVVLFKYNRPGFIQILNYDFPGFPRVLQIKIILISQSG